MARIMQGDMGEGRYGKQGVDYASPEYATPLFGESKLSKKELGPKSPSYRHAQKEAMQKGDAGTYFMRKTGKRKRGGKRGGK